MDPEVQKPLLDQEDEKTIQTDFCTRERDIWDIIRIYALILSVGAWLIFVAWWATEPTRSIPPQEMIGYHRRAVMIGDTVYMHQVSQYDCQLLKEYFQEDIKFQCYPMSRFEGGGGGGEYEY